MKCLNKPLPTIATTMDLDNWLNGKKIVCLVIFFTNPIIINNSVPNH